MTDQPCLSSLTGRTILPSPGLSFFFDAGAPRSLAQNPRACTGADTPAGKVVQVDGLPPLKVAGGVREWIDRPFTVPGQGRRWKRTRQGAIRVEEIPWWIAECGARSKGEPGERGSREAERAAVFYTDRADPSQPTSETVSSHERQPPHPPAHAHRRRCRTGNLPLVPLRPFRESTLLRRLPQELWLPERLGPVWALLDP